MADNIYHQIRFVRRIENDGTLITFPRLGHPYESHNQKTLKSYHRLEEVIQRAKEYNPGLPVLVKGMVVVRFRAGGGRVSTGKVVRPYVGANSRKTGTTEWLAYIDREGRQFNIIEGTHRIGR